HKADKSPVTVDLHQYVFRRIKRRQLSSVRLGGDQKEDEEEAKENQADDQESIFAPPLSSTVRKVAKPVENCIVAHEATRINLSGDGADDEDESIWDESDVEKSIQSAKSTKPLTTSIDAVEATTVFDGSIIEEEETPMTDGVQESPVQV